MIKQICLRMPNDLYDSIKEKADATGLSLTKYIVAVLSHETQLVQQSFPDEPDNDMEYDKEQKLYTYRFNWNDVRILRQKAKAFKLSDTAYLRMLIRTKNFKYIDYSTDDLEQYISESQRLIDSVTNFVDYIHTSGKSLVFAPDIRRIMSMLEEIKTIHKQQVQLTFTNRQKVYRDMIKKIEDAL